MCSWLGRAVKLRGRDLFISIPLLSCKNVGRNRVVCSAQMKRMEAIQKLMTTSPTYASGVMIKKQNKKNFNSTFSFIKLKLGS